MDTLEKAVFLYFLDLADRELIKEKIRDRIISGDHEPILYALLESDDMTDTEFGEMCGSLFAHLTGTSCDAPGLGTMLYRFLAQGSVSQSDAYRMMERVLEIGEGEPKSSYYIGNLCIYATAQDFMHPIDMTRLMNKAWPQAGYPDNWTHLVGRESDIDTLKTALRESGSEKDSDCIKEKISNAIAEIKKDTVNFVTSLKPKA